MADTALNIKIGANTQQLVKDIKDAFSKIPEAVQEATANVDLSGLNAKLSSSLTTMGRVVNRDTSALSPEASESVKEIQAIGRAVNKLEGVFRNMLTKSFDIIETIYKELKKSSPLLQAVEQLFNLAWTLFFMPLGNKLGEMLIPAVIQLVDDVTAMWEEFGGGGLGEMFNVAIQWGVNALSNFLSNIGETLRNEGGLLGAIGNVLTALGRFVEGHLVNLLNGLVSLLGFIIDNLKHILSAIIAFKTASIMAQIATMMTIAGSETWAGKFGAGFIVAGAAASYLVSEAALSSLGMAEGGYVPATEGGQVHVLGEGGEGEYVIPESKMGQFGGNTYNVNIYSYSTDELADKVRSIVAGEVSASRLRSGF